MAQDKNQYQGEQQKKQVDLNDLPEDASADADVKGGMISRLGGTVRTDPEADEIETGE